MDVAKLLVTRAKAKHQMLAMMKKVRETPVGGGIIGILSANPRDARRVSDDGLQAASVEERVVLKPAIRRHDPCRKPMHHRWPIRPTLASRRALVKHQRSSWSPINRCNLRTTTLLRPSIDRARMVDEP